MFAQERNCHACASKESVFPRFAFWREKGRKNDVATATYACRNHVNCVALGVGIGLLLSSKLGHSERKAAGLALTLVGALTTVPLALNVLGKKDVATTSEIRPAA